MQIFRFKSYSYRTLLVPCQSLISERLVIEKRVTTVPVPEKFREFKLGTGLIVIRVCVIRYSETMICAKSALSALNKIPPVIWNLELGTGNLSE